VEERSQNNRKTDKGLKEDKTSDETWVYRITPRNPTSEYGIGERRENLHPENQFSTNEVLKCSTG
jgi:hypothetical protein